MGYDKKELEEKALSEIESHKLVFINELVSYMPCSSATFYNHELEKLETIKEALNKNREEKKTKLRKNWEDSTNATLQVCLYKLIGTEEECHRINGSKQDLNIGGQKDNPINISIEMPNE